MPAVSDARTTIESGAPAHSLASVASAHIVSAQPATDIAAKSLSTMNVITPIASTPPTIPIQPASESHTPDAVPLPATLMLCPGDTGNMAAGTAIEEEAPGMFYIVT